MTISPTADGAAQRELSSAELCEMRAERGLMAVGESAVILLHPHLPLIIVSTGMERGCQQWQSRGRLTAP